MRVSDGIECSIGFQKVGGLKKACFKRGAALEPCQRLADQWFRDWQGGARGCGGLKKLSAVLVDLLIMKAAGGNLIR